MAFENLSEKLNETLKRLRGHGRITEKDVKEAMREIKLALLEADVSFKVVKTFIDKVSERAVGSDVLESLTPGQQIVKIVNDELTELLGGVQSGIAFSNRPPTVIMLVGLQGAGKTTMCGKLANMLRKKNNRRPLLVACDVYRPAAIKQLQVLGAQLDIPVFERGDAVSPVEISKQAVEHAKQHGNDVVIIDTAGRLHINEELMGELAAIKSAVVPNEILLVVDAMIGQDSVTVAESFNEQLGVDGIIMTKLDGDARGGAALSVKQVTGKPIKFIGTGEKLSDVEPFFPDRQASRILGMGDVLSLIDKAQEAFDDKEAQKLEEKLKKNKFDLQDFLEQMQQVKKMGSITQLLGMIPGVNAKALENVDTTESEQKMARTEAIIKSMTHQERENPNILNASRRRRIAAGSGVQVQDVNQLIRQFEQAKQMMKQFTNPSGGGKKGKKGRRMPGGFPGNSGGFLFR